LGAALQTPRGAGISSGIVTFEFAGRDFIALGPEPDRHSRLTARLQYRRRNRRVSRLIF